ncbi:MAG: tetratricopeptide repeat protein [Candidatus Marinimicrobia bacterium]|nr:tetratricopeptide repeat protein [Candidatus Neomarinimicrobiota bacterium]MCF7880276.1 tetratricopeptide repeat protein [Candidatus Neomarinimicrobiota bacterium]
MNRLVKRYIIQPVVLVVLLALCATTGFAQEESTQVPPELMNQSVQSLMEEGNRLFNEGEYREARPYYLAVVKKDSTQAGAYSRLSDVEYNLFDLTQAQKYLRQAIEVEPANEDYRVRFKSLSELVQTFQDGVEALRSQNHEEALNKFDEVLKAFPNFAPAFYHKGLVYRAQDKTDQSIENFKKAIDADPNNEKYGQAMENLAKTNFQEGVDAYRRGNLTGATDGFETALQIDPDFRQAQYMLGIIARRRGNVQEAIDRYQAAIEIDSSYAQAWFALGIAYKSTARDQQALNAFTKAGEINANYDKAFVEKGLMLLKMERFEEAEESLTKATQVNPQNPNAYEGLGLVYMKMGKYQQAIERFSTALAFDQSNHNIHYRMADAYHELGEYQNQKESARKALDIKPNYAPALVTLGDAECHLGNVDAAITAWEKAQSNPQWRPVAEHKIEVIEKAGECE